MVINPGYRAQGGIIQTKAWKGNAFNAHERHEHFRGLIRVRPTLWVGGVLEDYGAEIKMETEHGYVLWHMGLSRSTTLDYCTVDASENSKDGGRAGEGFVLHLQCRYFPGQY